MERYHRMLYQSVNLPPTFSRASSAAEAPSRPTATGLQADINKVDSFVSRTLLASQITVVYIGYTCKLRFWINTSLEHRSPLRKDSTLQYDYFKVGLCPFITKFVSKINSSQHLGPNSHFVNFSPVAYNLFHCNPTHAGRKNKIVTSLWRFFFGPNSLNLYN